MSEDNLENEGCVEFVASGLTAPNNTIVLTGLPQIFNCGGRFDSTGALKWELAQQ